MLFYKMGINSVLLNIIIAELGKNTADLFVRFYDSSPEKEQIQDARKVLKHTVGDQRASELLKNLYPANGIS